MHYKHFYVAYGLMKELRVDEFKCIPKLVLVRDDFSLNVSKEIIWSH